MTDTVARLCENVEHEHLAIKSLVTLLHKEQEVLVHSGIDSLPPLNDEKNQLINRLSDLANKRYSFLVLLGCTGDERGMSQWLNSNANNFARATYVVILKSLSQARELNRVNGLLIGKHLSRNNHALQALTANHRNSGVYGPDGQATRTLSRGFTA